MKVLYITYTGLMEPISQNQIIPYLRGLKNRGIEFVLLSYEKKDNLKNFDLVRRTEKILSDASIQWYRLRYHKALSLASKAYDVLMGTLWGLYLIIRYKIHLIHARNYVSTGVAIILKLIAGKIFLSDPRGLLADEYTEYGQWKAGGLKYRIIKRLETKYMTYTDGLVILTKRHLNLLEKDYPVLRKNIPVSVIPCCVDTGKFVYKRWKRDQLREKYGLSNRPIMVYIGILGSWCLLEEMVDFFNIARNYLQRLYFWVLTQSDGHIAESVIKKKNVDRGDYTVMYVPPPEIPDYLSASDIGITFIKPGMSKVASSPTKIGEYLSCGLPILINNGIGDLNDILTSHRVGVGIEKFSKTEYVRAAVRIRSIMKNRKDARRRSRQAAIELFDLNRCGVDQYLALYKKMVYA